MDPSSSGTRLHRMRTRAGTVCHEASCCSHFPFLNGNSRDVSKPTWLFFGSLCILLRITCSDVVTDWHAQTDTHADALQTRSHTH